MQFFRLATLVMLLGLLAGCSGSAGPGSAPAPEAQAPGPARVADNQGFLVVSQRGGLLRLDRDGQDPFPLTWGFNDSHPAYRPDGSDVIFTRTPTTGAGKADIYRIRPDGTGLADLTAGFPYDAVDPDYAWDGSRIVFSARVGPTDQDIYVMNADGTQITAVTSGPDIDRRPALSPDGSAVVFERGSRICRVSATGGPVTYLTDGTSLDTYPSYCPPGDAVVFSREGDLWTIENQVVAQLTDTPREAEFHARHSQEHDRIFTLAAVGPTGSARSGEAPPTGEIFVMRPDGTQQERITDNVGASELAVGPNKTTFTVRIENKSKYLDSEVFLNLTGQNEAKTANFYLASPTAPSLTQYDDTPGTLLGKKADGSFVGNAKYFITLSDLQAVPGAPHTYTMEVPRENLISGRLTMSFGQRLPGIGINAPGYAFAVDGNGAPTGDGTPVTQGVTGNGVADPDGVTIRSLSIDATREIYAGEPVSGPNVPAGTTVLRVTSQRSIVLSQAITGTYNSLTFTPPPFNIPLALQGPSFTGAPDYLIPFEFMEFSATRDVTQADPWYTLFLNTSVVDFFSVGLGMKVDFGDGTSRTVGFVDGKRDQLLTDFNDLPADANGFKGFVLAGTGTSFRLKVPDVKKILRVLAPQNILQLRPTDPFHDYLKPVVDAAWTHYQSTVLDIPDNLPGHNSYGFKYSGSLITGGILGLTCTAVPNGQTGLNEAYRLPKPSTFIVFKCDDTAPPPDSYSNDGTDAHKKLGALLLAALNRGVFDDYLSWSNNKNGQATFFQRTDGLYNIYAQILHRYAIDNKVYGFGYDDIYGQDPTIAGPIGKTEAGKDPPGGSPITQVTVLIPAFDKF